MLKVVNYAEKTRQVEIFLKQKVSHSQKKPAPSTTGIPCLGNLHI